MPRTHQLPSRVNAGHVLEVDIQDKARRLAQVSARKKVFNSVEDLSLKSMELQHPLHRPEDTRVIIYNDNSFARAHG